MVSLPISIEDHLAQAGFCGTEILVLRHMLSGQQYTVRELASKTGKSTGVLDQSVKKLLRKKIITRQMVNTSPKYAIGSLATLSSYLQSYFRDHVSQTKRRAEDMGHFLQTLEVEHNQPKVEHFIGKEGIKKLYEKVASLAQGVNEIHTYMPITEDIIEEFSEILAGFTQFRRKRNIMMHVLTHESLVSKRYQSEDYTRNRETRFIQPDRCLLYIEHLMVGSAYFCIDYKRMTGYMIDYAEFTDEKRCIFKSLWAEAALKSDISSNKKCNEKIAKPNDLEQLAEFCFSLRSMAVHSILILTALLCVFMLQIFAPFSVSIAGPLGPVFDFMGCMFLLVFTRLLFWWRPLLQKVFTQVFVKVSLATCVALSICAVLF